MKPEEAFENLQEYYEGYDDSHEYIRESWDTLSNLVGQSTDSDSVEECHSCKHYIKCLQDAYSVIKPCDDWTEDNT